MKIFRNKYNLKLTNNSVLVIGNFDGLHKGHVSILNEATRFAKKNNRKIGLLTFDPNPKEFFSKIKNFKIISLREKQKILSAMKIDYLIILKFNKSLRNMTAENFIEKILNEKIRPSKIVVGKEFNGDEILNVQDVVLLINFIIGNIEPTANQYFLSFL